MRLTERLNRIPPNLCRLLARSAHGLRLMTVQEICDRSQLCRMRVIQISKLSSWSSLPVEDVQAFSEACGVNLLAPAEQLKFLRRRKRAYLERATAGQRRMLARIMATLVSERG